MAETEQTKVCPLCAETIKAAAKVCPFCRKSQRPWAIVTAYDVSAILAPLVFIGAVFLFAALFQTQRDFSVDRDKIRVLDVHFARDTSTTNMSMIAFGIVTNESEHSWIIDQFEIRYLDTKGKLLSVDHQPVGFTILPKSNHSFSVGLDSDAFFPSYATSEVTVISARDPKAPFQLFGD